MKHETQSVPEASWPPSCDGCGDPLTEPGALVFSPPNLSGQCWKKHLCTRCYDGFYVWLCRQRPVGGEKGSRR
jgi:hypothetical protein